MGGLVVPRVMIVEDHWVWASAVEKQLERAEGMTVVGVATTAESAIEMAGQLNPDVALVDLLLGDDSGLRVARVLRSRGSAVRIVIISTERSAYAVEEARQCGVAGFVSKDDLLTQEQIVTVVSEVAAGHAVFSPSIGLDAATASLPYGLTSQEQEMIRCMSEGMGTDEIARYLSVGQQTVRNKTSVIGRKLNVSGRLEIVSKALSEAIISGPKRT